MHLLFGCIILKIEIFSNFKAMNKNNLNGIAIIGLGYVGLPLAIEFGKIRNVIGYDIKPKRIQNLKKKIDTTKEVKSIDIYKSKFLSFTNDISDIKKCSTYIITVPTPIDSKFKPNLSFIKNAAKDVSKILKINDLVILESTVYPGTTEEILVPTLEKYSKLKFNSTFFVGYSPERVNPGDKINKISNIVKVTSGSNKKTALAVDNLYKQIVKAGTYMAPSIKVAESSKIIENVQRDLNISLVNELSLIFDKLNINTNEVLKAAKTKWNFLPFQPGLVGGHCIGVDPYYLTYKARKHGYNPKIILSGRKVNNEMAIHVAKNILLKLKKYKYKIAKVKIGILGISFKENCPDIRNSKVIDIINFLKEKNVKIDIYDPLVDYDEIPKFSKNIKLVNEIKNINLLLLAVNHKQFRKYKDKDILNFFGKHAPIIFDIKSSLNRSKLEKMGADIWSL